MRVVEVQVADAPEAWAAAGFVVDHDVVRLGTVALRLTGADQGVRGITGWTVAGLTVADGAIDGLPTTATASDGPAPAATTPASHPNGATGIDHLVVLTPDLDRTIAAVEATGLLCRRIRETEQRGTPMRQAFFRLGPTILEVVSGDVGVGVPASDAPATWFGLAIDVDDLDATATHLGDGLGRIKVAVQDGRRIATLRHQGFGMSVAVAAMDRHADR